MTSGDDERADGNADDKAREDEDAETEDGRGCSDIEAVELSDERDECVDEANAAVTATSVSPPKAALASAD